MDSKSLQTFGKNEEQFDVEPTPWRPVVSSSQQHNPIYSCLPGDLRQDSNLPTFKPKHQRKQHVIKQAENNNNNKLKG